MYKHEIDYEDEEMDDYIEDEAEEIGSKSNGFTQIPNLVLTDDKISIQSRLLYCNLLKYAWNKNFCFPTQETLSKVMGLSARSIRNYLKELVENKYVRIHRHGYESPNVYELLILPESKQFKKSYSDVYAKRIRQKRLLKLARYIRSKKQSISSQNGNGLPTNNTKEKNESSMKKTKKRANHNFLQLLKGKKYEK